MGLNLAHVHGWIVAELARRRPVSESMDTLIDSGDFVLLGELTSSGLRPIDPDAKRPEIPIEPVLESLCSSDSKEVFRAVHELQRFGERAQAAIPELLRVVSSDEIGLRQAAVNMLAAIAPDDPRAKAAILHALNDSSPYVRREALQALISIKGLSDAELGRIEEMRDDAEKHVARWSKVALRNIRLRRETTNRSSERPA